MPLSLYNFMFPTLHSLPIFILIPLATSTLEATVVVHTPSPCPSPIAPQTSHGCHCPFLSKRPQKDTSLHVQVQQELGWTTGSSFRGTRHPVAYTYCSGDTQPLSIRAISNLQSYYCLFLCSHHYLPIKETLYFSANSFLEISISILGCSFAL